MNAIHVFIAHNRGQVPINPFNNFVRNIEMKSIDKFVLVLVASLALLLAGCGGGSSTTTPVDPGPTAGEMAIMQAQTALTNAEEGLSGATTDAAMLAAYRAIQTAADNLVTALSTHGGSAADIAAAARKSGNAKAMADDLAEKVADAEMKANMAMMATATKLYAGIGATPLVVTGGHAVAVDATSGVWSVDPADVAPANLTNQALTADEDTMVAANHGWEGSRHTASGDAVTGTYEAVIYSHLDDPTVTEGAVFSATYTLDATTGETADVTGLTGHTTGRVASPSFDQDAGLKAFKPGTNDIRIMLGGSYQGVPGTYYCTPTDRAVGCTADVADMGFTLAGGTWTFKPTNPAMKLMDTSADDTEYASYGWWLHKSEDGDTYTASAFAVYRGTAPTVEISALRGSATYTGGAAGKYSLRGDTGGTNDAGHFTADVTLEATFADTHSISGTVDNFTGGDGESRDWSVALSPSVVDDAGPIAGALAADGTPDSTDTGPQMTTWTIGDVAGDAAGQWSGNLHEEGDDGVPAIATGTFFSTFGDSGNDGRMVGAFGVNVDD